MKHSRELGHLSETARGWLLVSTLFSSQETWWEPGVRRKQQPEEKWNVVNNEENGEKNYESVTEICCLM